MRLLCALAPVLLILVWAVECGADEPTGSQAVPSRDAVPSKAVEPNGDGEPNVPRANEDGGNRLPLLAVYSALILLASLTGGWLPFVMHLTHTRMQLMVSLVAGLMLGIGLFHMLPHAVAELGSIDRAVWWTMLGLLGMFFLIRAFHFHQHGEIEIPSAMPGTARLMSGPGGPCPHDHDHDHEGHHSAEPAALETHHSHSRHGHRHAHAHELSWTGVAFGLAVHTLIDGIALAASVEAEAGHAATASLFGLGTFLAILLHKPLDAVSITSLMAAGGWPARTRHLVNGGFALMCPAGVLLFYLGVQQFSSMQHVFVGCALAFAAGVFLCISLGDLLPEVEFHAHDRVKLSAALLVGIALAYAIGFLEPDHAHSHGGRGHTRPAAASSGR